MKHVFLYESELWPDVAPDSSGISGANVYLVDAADRDEAFVRLRDWLLSLPFPMEGKVWYMGSSEGGALKLMGAMGGIKRTKPIGFTGPILEASKNSTKKNGEKKNGE